jgi:hypothetical protein
LEGAEPARTRAGPTRRGAFRSRPHRISDGKVVKEGFVRPLAGVVSRDAMRQPGRQHPGEEILKLHGRPLWFLQKSAGPEHFWVRERLPRHRTRNASKRGNVPLKGGAYLDAEETAGPPLVLGRTARPQSQGYQPAGSIPQITSERICSLFALAFPPASLALAGDSWR